MNMGKSTSKDYLPAQDLPSSMEVDFPDAPNQRARSAHGNTVDGGGSKRFCGTEGRGETGRTISGGGAPYGKKRSAEDAV